MDIRIVRTSHTILLSAFAFLAFLYPARAHGEESVQEQIFDNCETAKTLFKQLSKNERREILDYLVRVISLNTGAPAVREAFVLPQVAVRGYETEPSPLWQSVDAQRELEAKRCALDILELSGAEAVHILPELVEVYSEENLGDELGLRIEEVTSSITDAAVRAGTPPSPTDLNSIIWYLLASHPLIAKQILAEFIDLALPHALLLLVRLEDEDAWKILNALHEIDPSGVVSLNALVAIAPQLDSFQIERLQRYISLPEDTYLPEVTQNLADISAFQDPLIALPFAKLFGEACERLGFMSLTPATEATVSARPLISLLSPGAMPLESQKCLAQSVPQLATYIQDTLKFSEDTEFLEYANKLLPSIMGQLDSRDRAYIYTRLKNLTFTTTPPKQSITLLSEFEERSHDTVKVYLQLLKEIEHKTNTSEQKEKKQEILNGLLILEPVSELGPFVPFLTDELASEDDYKISQDVLSRFGSKVESALLNAWKKADISVRLRILQIFQTMPAISKKAVDVLSEGLSVNELREATNSLLPRQAPDVGVKNGNTKAHR